MRQWLLGICLVTQQIMILVEQVGHQEGPNRNKGHIASFVSCNDYIAIYWWQTPAANTVWLGSWSISANRCNTYLKRQADVEISLRKSTPFFHTSVRFYNMSVPWKVLVVDFKNWKRNTHPKCEMQCLPSCDHKFGIVSTFGLGGAKYGAALEKSLPKTGNDWIDDIDAAKA